MTPLVSVSRCQTGGTALVSPLTPVKKQNVYRKPVAGSPPRPVNQLSHGTIDAMHGTPAASAWSETGLATVGVTPVRIRSTWSCRIASRAASAARLVSDAASLVMISSW